MLNEAAYVEQFAGDVAAQDFDGEVELVVADGGSSDGSVERLRAAGASHDLALTVLENPSRWVSPRSERMYPARRGDLLVRLDCHSRYAPDYLRRCAVVAEETGAEAVGGIVVPRGRTWFERAVSCAMDSPFGGIGWMRGTETPTRGVGRHHLWRVSARAFERAGLFDESLIRNQDDEFTLRFRRSGCRVVLDSTIQVHYTPRGHTARSSTVLPVRPMEGAGNAEVPPGLERAQPRSASLPRLARDPGSERLLPRVLPWRLLAEVAAYAAGAFFFAARASAAARALADCRSVATVFPTFHSATAPEWPPAGYALWAVAERVARAAVPGRDRGYSARRGAARAHP